jgi:hypothetical protein
MGQYNPKSISWWHEHLADWMIMNPDRDIRDAAMIFSCSVNYLYMLKNSDSFKEYWAFRRKQVSAAVEGKTVENLGGLHEKISAVADMALDQLLEQLDKNGLAQRAGAPLLDHDDLRGTADMALKKLGYGIPAQGAGGSSPQLTQVNVSIDASLLASAREKMKQLHGVEPSPPAPEGEQLLLEAPKAEVQGE